MSKAGLSLAPQSHLKVDTIAHTCHPGDPMAIWEAEMGKHLEAHEPASVAYAMVNHKGPCLKPGEGEGRMNTHTPARLHTCTPTHAHRHIFAGAHKRSRDSADSSLLDTDARPLVGGLRGGGLQLLLPSFFSIRGHTFSFSLGQIF